MAELELGSPEAQQLLASENASHVSKLGTFRVLLVEDDSLQRLNIASLFDAANRKNEGAVKFELTMAESAAEAVRKLTDAPRSFNLVLLDLLLPDQNGFDVLPVLRQEVDDDVAIVIVSAHPELSLVQLCVRRGADAFLAKPLDLNDVCHCWQFVKEQALPEGSFKADLESLHPSAAMQHLGLRTTMAAEVEGCPAPERVRRGDGEAAGDGAPSVSPPPTNASQGSLEGSAGSGTSGGEYFDAREHPLGCDPNQGKSPNQPVDAVGSDCRTA